MTVPIHQLVDTAVFDAVRQILKERTGKGLTEADVRLINGALAMDDPPAPVVAPVVTGQRLSVKVVTELMHHEAIIQELYKDSVGVETWSAGLTAKSGINIRKYKDNPAPMQECIDAVIERLRAVYVPDVLAAFTGKNLTETQFAAALSFHYNTGAIRRADWVKLWLAGDTNAAFISFMNWKSPPEIKERREHERDLFFRGAWRQDGNTTVYLVNKPSYSPKWSSARRVNVSAEIKKALGV
jgi:GH24 family phage-related lysozyme (muramidase)